MVVRAAVLLAALVVVGCAGRTLTVEQTTDRGDRITYDVRDETGLVRAATLPAWDPTLAGRAVNGAHIFNPPGRPGLVVVQWVGADCISAVDVLVARTTAGRLSISVGESEDRCPEDLGISRAVGLELTTPVPLEAIDPAFLP